MADRCEALEAEIDLLGIRNRHVKLSEGILQPLGFSLCYV